ncbi:MAG: squalene/phytoene synthase family protein [Elusimicrobia bacterium]|nr:squalene/phytoene synthase family protein [Elusimicrobiota bacterium]
MKLSFLKRPLSVFRMSNFAPAFILLPPRRRHALAAVYAFARAVDDAVDEIGIDANEPDRARAVLGRWRAVLNGEPADFEGREAAVWKSLQTVLSEFPIAKNDLLDLVDGVERDLTQTRYATFDALRVYCHGVAGTVGLACLPIFGLGPDLHRTFAEKLGLAMQLVNIIRDVKTDALRGRIYLPQEDLVRFGFGEAEVLAQVYNDNYRRMMAFQAERARAVFAEARAALPAESRRRARPALAMGRIYEMLLEKLESQGFAIFGEPPRLSFFERLRALAV